MDTTWRHLPEAGEFPTLMQQISTRRVIIFHSRVSTTEASFQYGLNWMPVELFTISAVNTLLYYITSSLFLSQYSGMMSDNPF